MEPQTIRDFNALVANSKFVFALVYRGHWCPFCISHIRSLKALEHLIRHADGETVIITSEREEHLPKVRSATGYTGPAIVDTQNLLVADLKKRDIVDVAISDMRLRKYEHGMAQPAVFVIRQGGTVLYRWAIVPSLMNLGGAKDRPLLEEIWHNVDASLHGKEAVHTTYSTAGVAAVIREKLRSR
ncbi:uncharacterized protein B0I36DRAFT_370212 [Microdochium trichocladiopsis]|uniref:Alkyl hydroperoxide reductase subunit C/ Thiol specific antioxidant domain-containing protein n=1 Tax=Microdochium trichocladiopsis TaxID=1682393 RepID=A0A9P8XQ34_9PEZI|nr:uncharacterized protein B0I36DRAFT_370212 [Microdochium trichocladiopsis]KAH7010602.1 hypothetical protein B0I36DRAFT_370212 [Microdochium trichocladiopsis]